MRLTAGKIYFWGGVFILALTVWNRYSTRNLRGVVERVKAEKMREVAQLRHGALGDDVVLRQPMPAHFDPYHNRQEQERLSLNK